MLRIRLLAGVLVGLVLTGCSARALEDARAAVSPGAVVTSLSTREGALAGGTVIEVSGTHLSTIARVTIGGQNARIESLESTRIDLVVPHSVDYVPDRVVAVEFLATDGRILASDEYTYRVSTGVDRQLAYAFEHWNSYNLAAYGDFNAWGGDCINFVSQTLVARGWATSSEWFNDAQQDWAPAFVHVPSFDSWLAAHPELGAVRLDLDDRDRASIGDVVVIDWDADGSLDHAQVISGIDGEGDSTRIALVGHNLDTMYRDLDAALATQGGPNATAWIWSLPAP